jgi:molecular chaperone GrpE (heat shock protein)
MKMKKDIKKSAGGKVSKTLLALIDNIKKVAADGTSIREEETINFNW